MNWKIKDIELANISRFRGELMGAAMLFIILFHVALPREDAFYGLRRMGNVGVDMFLFLSGIGLWFSWMKTPSARHFFIRRYLRIYPTWLIIACLFYIPGFHGGSTWNWINLFGDTFNRITSRGFDNLTEFQQAIIIDVCCDMADFEYENEDMINCVLQNYAVNGVSMQFGSSWNVLVQNGIAVKRDTYRVLCQTGLCCLSLGV